MAALAEQEAEKISIVIPAYNCAETIGRCIESAAAQTYPNKEIIVVDDGSTDRTPEVLDTLREKYAELRVIHRENGGVAAARNDGMRAATGTWLVTLDADDYIDADMLQSMHAAAKREEADLVICGFRMVFAQEEHKELRQVDEEFEGNRSELINTMFLELYDKQLLNNQNNKLYRLSIIQEHQLYYDPEMQINEDLWFSLSFLRYSSEIAVMRRAFLNYTQHAEGESLVSKYHENCVDTCFAVLKAYDALFDSCSVSDETVNAMNNRMLFLICGYAGWQYYKTDMPEAELLERIRALCERPELQKLLEQTDPIGLKNRTAHYLLKRKKAEAYHKLCMLLYQKKRRARAEAEEKKKEAAVSEEKTAETKAEPETQEKSTETEKKAEETAAAPSTELEAAEKKTAETESKIVKTETAAAAEEKAETEEKTPVKEAKGAALPEENAAKGKKPTASKAKAGSADKKAKVSVRKLQRSKQHHGRHDGRRPHNPVQIDGQAEMLESLRANGKLDGITDQELEEITKKLESSF